MALRGKVILSQLNFFQLAYTSMFSIDNYMYGKNQVLIKKKNQTKNEKHVFRRSFLKDGQTKNSCHSQHDAFFCYRLFCPGFALLYAFFLVTHVILYSNLIFWKRNAGGKGFSERLST